MAFTNYSSTVNALTGSGGGGSNWFSRLSPEVQGALISSGIGLAGGLISGYGQGKQAEADREASQAQTELGVRSRNVDRALELALQRESMDQAGRAGAAGMMGSSPLQFQQERNKMALLKAFLQGEGRIGIQAPSDIASSVGNVQLPTFSPESLRFLDNSSMASAEQPYWNAVSSLNPNLPSPQLGSVGYGAEGSAISKALDAARQTEGSRQQAMRATNDSTLAAERAALMQALGSDSNTAAAKRDEKKKKGGSAWGTIGNIALGLGTAYLGGKLGGAGKAGGSGGKGWF